MNNELLRKLKDAGFPYEWESSCLNDGRLCIPPPPTCTPSLSELIEACEKNFGCLHKFRGKFSASVSRESKIGYSITEDYQTPEEAVVNLWLKLKKR